MYLSVDLLSQFLDPSTRSIHGPIWNKNWFCCSLQYNKPVSPSVHGMGNGGYMLYIYNASFDGLVHLPEKDREGGGVGGEREIMCVCVRECVRAVCAVCVRVSACVCVRVCVKRDNESAPTKGRRLGQTAPFGESDP